MTDEEYVRARIEEVHDNGVCLWVVLDRIYTFSPSHGKPIADAWLRLRAFTEQREREIAEVEKEIVLIENAMKIHRHNVSVGRKVCQHVKAICRWSRILSREQGVLAELRRGMKEGSE